jgi:amidophosphoribosyltransferase
VGDPADGGRVEVEELGLEAFAPRREELVAARMSHAELVDHLGVDSLGYLSIDGMLAQVPTGPGGYCHACFSGRYPTATPAEPELLRAGGAASRPGGVA